MKHTFSNFLLSIFFLVAISFFIHEIYIDVYTNIELNNSYQESLILNEELTIQLEEIENEIELYQDVDYVLRIAAGRYYSTENSDDQIFTIPDTDDSTSE